MKRLVDLAKLARLDNLIRHEATGSPEELAERLGMSRANVFNIIRLLREDMHAPIEYNPCRPSYVYTYKPVFNLGFERERFETIELENTFGGGVDEKVQEKKNTKKKITVEIDVDIDYILDEDIDFCNLYT